MKLVTLRKRREFLRIRGGGRCSTHAFVLETKRRVAGTISGTLLAQAFEGPRFGFTVTKRLGNAVVRNRIRRRLKAALADVAKTAANDHFDYVVIARAAARDMAFDELVGLMQKAFERVHRPKQKSDQRRRKSSSKGNAVGSRGGDDKNKSEDVTR